MTFDSTGLRNSNYIDGHCGMVSDMIDWSGFFFFKAQNTKNENKNMTGIKRRSEAQVFTVLNVM